MPKVESWYDKVYTSQGSNFSLIYRIPDLEARNYYQKSRIVSLDSFTRLNLSLFKCHLCLQEVAFKSFQAHYERDCQKLEVSCQQCKAHRCPRDQLSLHKEVCPESEYQCPQCEQIILRRFLSRHDCMELLITKLNSISASILSTESELAT